jgi:hypothetical protein
VFPRQLPAPTSQPLHIVGPISQNTICCGTIDTTCTVVYNSLRRAASSQRRSGIRSLTIRDDALSLRACKKMAPRAAARIFRHLHFGVSVKRQKPCGEIQGIDRHAPKMLLQMANNSRPPKPRATPQLFAAQADLQINQATRPPINSPRGLPPRRKSHAPNKQLPPSPESGDSTSFESLRAFVLKTSSPMPHPASPNASRHPLKCRLIDGQPNLHSSGESP